MARRIYIYNNKYTWLIVLVVIALIAFLWYYFRNSGAARKGEKCPDGRNIPENRDCGTLPVLKDPTGEIKVTPVVADANGCISVSKYTTNIFPLALGMYGDHVKTLQQNLNKYFNLKGKDKLDDDGYFGCITLNAVIKNLGVRTVEFQMFSNPGLWIGPAVTLSPNTTG